MIVYLLRHGGFGPDDGHRIDGYYDPALNDVGAAQAAGCKGAALIKADELDAFTFDVIGDEPQWKKISEQMEEASETGADAIVPDVAVAADWILEMEKLATDEH